MIEISVRVSNSDLSMTEKYLVHEEGMCLSKDDPHLSKMVEETVKKFKGDVDDVLVRIKYTW